MSLPDGLDFVYRPMLSTPPLCRYQELIDGTYSLEDIANMHDALDVMQENMRRAAAVKRD